MSLLNKKINWKPKSTGEGRFGNWLSNANDWNLSRSRFWGVPLPVWRTDDGKETKVIGSIAELNECIEISLKNGFMKQHPFEGFKSGDFSDSNYNLVDLHKNVVDNIILTSSKGKAMRRESDLIDVWFDSGAMPYAQWHYPFENKDLIDNGDRFPADYIAEGVDQTRGWFYTLHAIGTLVFGKEAYKNVISNGLVLDKIGQKMSKRLGNAIDPFKTLDKFGPDATRWYMISNANPWDNLKFDIEGIAEVQRKFFGTIYNTYSFFSLYANIDNFDPKKEEIIPHDKRTELDKWIISELNSLILVVDSNYEDYEPTKSCRAISDFTQEKLSNWYVRLNRRRFWKGEYGQDKIAAYQTLHECLTTLAKLGSAIAPFYMDHLYKDLILEENSSVHLADFPKVNHELINRELEKQTNTARNLTSLALSLRKKERIKVRQPLKKIIIPAKDKLERKRIKSIVEQLKSEINIKEVEILDDENQLLVKDIRPNFKTLGPRFGKNLKLIVKIISELNSDQINTIEEKGELDVKINEKNITLGNSDVEIFYKDIEGWQVAKGGGMTVALDITLSPKLINEGIARELVNRIQNYRKDAGFKVVDKIDIYIKNERRLEKAVEENLDYILSETLASSLRFESEISNGTFLEFDNIKTDILIKKLIS